VNLRVITILVGLVVLLIGTQRVVEADYSPVNSPYTSWRVGSGDLYWWEEGTPLTQDGVDAWNYWLGAYFSEPAHIGANPCDDGIPCILFMNENDEVNGTTCTVPDISGTSVRAKIYISVGTSTNLWQSHEQYYDDCLFGSEADPIFVIVVNDDACCTHNSALQLHIQRHEVGHALGLGDTGTSCEWDSVWLWPLMQNDLINPCEDAMHEWPENFSATWNELEHVLDWNSWD
jgi:hypothetical protein